MRSLIMAINENRYEVMWGLNARVNLAEMKPFKINPKMVFRNTISVLATNPREKAVIA